MAKASTKWLPLFKTYISRLRIQSKHATEDLDGTGIALDMWTSQNLVLEQICDGIENGVHVFYILKSRQLGVTTITLAILLFWLALHPNTIGCLVSDSDKNAAKNRETIRRYLASLAPFMGKSFSAKKDNRYGFVFSNDSRLDLLVAGKSKVNWGEGEGYVVGHLTEVGSYGKEEGLESFRHAMAPDNPRALYIYEGPLALDTPVATPTGWTTMGDVRGGDRVLDDQGKPCRVIGLSPVFEGRKCYEIEFQNGDKITADGVHKWQVERRRWPTNPQWKTCVVSTEELDISNDRIRVTEPLDLPDINLPIDPYLLGVWLGDGRTDSTRITGDRDRDAIREILSERGLNPGPVSKQDDRVGVFTVLGERGKFVELGLLGNKHIPVIYQRASERQRRALLAGLMDTDGSIDSKNLSCNFTSTLPAVIEGVKELLSGLGIKWAASPCGVAGKVRVFPTGNASVCQASTRLLFSEQPDREVFAIARKRDKHQRARGPQGHIWRKTKCLKIKSITEVSTVPVRCIAVDAPSHLFLAGKTMIPTHNTAHGPNHWKDMWEAAKEDVYSSRCIFVGWWSHNLQRIKRSDRRFQAFGTLPPTPDENEKITAVKRLYEYDITMEQLAWYRWEATRPNASSTDLDQNQPWIDTDAFIQSGVSFFQQKLITNRREEITSAPPVGVEDGGYGYKAYSFYLADEYHLSKVEAITTAVDPSSIKLRVWEHPHPDGLYIIGVDPAGGRSEDSNAHCCSVWRAFADKMVQVAEWADSVPDTRHCAWVTAYLAGQYQNCRINIDLTGGVGSAVMQAFDDLKTRMRSELYQAEINRYATLERRNREMERPNDPKAPNGMFNFEDFLTASSWYLYRRIDAPGPGYSYNTKLGRDLKWRTMNMMRDSWVTNVVEIRSVPLLDEMVNIVQTKADIGAAAVGRQRDDRTFAMSLANFTWLENLRGGLISQGITWEGSRAKESGEISPIADTLNRRIYGILRAADEMQDLPPPKSFYEHRGL